MSVKHDHEHERTENMMPRLQQPHREGLALCHRVILDSVAHWWVPARTPTVRQCLHGGMPWVARSNLHETTNDNKTKTDLESNVLSGNRCSHTLGILHIWQDTAVKAHVENIRILEMILHLSRKGLFEATPQLVQCWKSLSRNILTVM